MTLNRRDFLKRVGRIALTTGLASFSLPGCINPGQYRKNLNETLSEDHYAKLTKDWDPIYGPPIQPFSRYGGPGNFQGHIQGKATPGIDYDVSMGTPLVPMMASYLRQNAVDPFGAVYLLFADIFNPAYRISMAHLEDIFVDEKYLLSGDVMKYLSQGIRVLERGEMVARSGNSGIGPKEYGWVQPPHLHVSLYFLNFKSNTLAYLDPEKFGIDGGRPVFWDGETLLDGKAEERTTKLELTLRDFIKELHHWPKDLELEELKGLLLEHYHLLGKKEGHPLIDSKHFHDLRALLKKVTLEEKKVLPGTKPYRLMLKILGYSTNENQKIILTLPFIAPTLRENYKKTIYEEGSFFNLIPQPNPS